MQFFSFGIIVFLIGVTCVQPLPIKGRTQQSVTIKQLKNAYSMVVHAVQFYSSHSQGYEIPKLGRLRMSKIYLQESMKAFKDNKMHEFYLRMHTTQQLLSDSLTNYPDKYISSAQQIIEGVLNKFKTKTSEAECSKRVDIAIIGAGVSGAYTAWRMRNDNKKISMYEYSNRIGGRMFSTKLANGMVVELGGMRYHPKNHDRWARLAKELGLTIIPFAGVHAHKHEVNFLRGTRRRVNETNKVGDFPGYPVREDEKDKNYAQLRWMIFNKTVDVASQKNVDHFDYVTRDGRNLRDIGLWNMVTEQASEGVRDFLKDSFPYDYEFLNRNAAFMGVAPEPDINTKGMHDVMHTLKEGMSAVPQGLVRRFLQASKKHKLHTNHLLKSIKKVGGLLHLKFTRTASANGITWETHKKKTVCAKQVILGIPARSLQILDWDPVQNDEQVISDIQSQKGTPAIKAFLQFSRPWWRNLKNTRRVVTDLPTRQTLEMEVRKDGSALLLASYSSGDNVEYWEGLMQHGKAIKGSVPNQYNITDTMLEKLLSFIAVSMGVKKENIPEPIGAGVQIWNSDPVGYAWYSLLPGYDWRDVRERMCKPHKDHEVYVVSTFGHWEHSKWADGTIKVAEYTLAKYFNIKSY